MITAHDAREMAIAVAIGRRNTEESRKAEDLSSAVNSLMETAFDRIEKAIESESEEDQFTARFSITENPNKEAPMEFFQRMHELGYITSVSGGPHVWTIELAF